MKDDFNFICEVIANFLDVSVALIDKEGNILEKTSINIHDNPLYDRNQSYHPYLNDEFLKVYDLPVIKQTIYLENFLIISITKDNTHESNLIVGPVIYSELPDNVINSLMNDYFIFNQKRHILDYFKSLPIMKEDKLINLGQIVYYMIYQRPLNKKDMTGENDNSLIEMENVDLEISKRRQDTLFHQNPQLEKKVLNGIKEGRVNKVEKLLNLIPGGNTGVLSKGSYIRNHKNLCIVTITLATRAAIDGGLHSEVAFTLSDLYIQRIEGVNDNKSIAKLLEESLYAFTNRVKSVKDKKYSKHITMCNHYIFNHLYESITLNDVAEHVGLNSSYLSLLFKKEIGHTVSEHIQRGKIDEAKNLLTLTNNKVTEIAALLNFSDQSYFTKVFKKHTGKTPAIYRKTYAISGH